MGSEHQQRVGSPAPASVTRMDTSSTCALVVAATACVTDIRSRRIPNILTFGSAAAALIYHSIAHGGFGFGSSASGWLVGALVMFVPFALGGLGGGDVKLLAALGAWVGPVNAVWLALYAGIAGGVMSVVVALYCGCARRVLSNIWLLLQHWQVAGLRRLKEISLEGSDGPRLAYALPIFAGLVLAIWLR
jgi:prepilin peptidase CpaA